MESIIAVSPVALLFVLMLGLKLSGHLSAFLTLLYTVILALAVSQFTDVEGALPTVSLVGYSLLEGVLKSLFPIFLIILMAVYSYNILVASGYIEVIKGTFSSFSRDRGVLVLMMVWGFGGLLEGMAGFGTAVAIPAAILIGLGFRPVFSAVVALLGNTVSTGFGAVGVPVITLCNEVSATGVASTPLVHEISGFAVLQLFPMFMVIPFVILMLTDRGRLWRNVVLAIWTGGVSFFVQLWCALYLGAETPAIIGSLAAIFALWCYVRVTEGKMVFGENEGNVGWVELTKGWSVYVLILLMVLGTGALFPVVNSFLKTHLVTEFRIPVLDSTFRFGWISNASLWLLLGSVCGGLIQGLSIRRLFMILCETLYSLRYTAVTIVCLISLASVMNHTGMTSSIALGLVALTGSIYPLFAPLVGGIGTFVTGSDTSSNILFGRLQSHAGLTLGLDSPHTFFGLEGSGDSWLVASNTTGATGGKMVSPQSIAIATGACDISGKDSEIMKRVIPYALIYVLTGGLLVWISL